MVERIEFSDETKRVIAARAGYVCSFPGCSAPTVGPGPESHQATNLGVAAHIYSAAAGGPRGHGDLASEQINHPNNGLWLCANHHREIDANHGRRYPPQVLLSFKGLREAQARRSLDGHGSAFGWLKELTVEESPVFSSGAKVVFGKATCIVGKNGSGKTALAEWLCGVANPLPLYRWLRSSRAQLKYQIKIHDPAEHSVDIHLGRARVTYFIDGREAPINPIAMTFVRPVRHYLTTPSDDLDWLSTTMNMDKLLIHNLLAEVGKYPWSTMRNLRLEDEDGNSDSISGRKPMRLIGEIDGIPKGIPMSQFASSELTRLFLELSIAAAATHARYVPSVVILDFAWTVFDDRWTRHYVEALLSTDLRFQTVFLTPAIPPGINWLGWERIDLVGPEKDVRIEQ
jgi:hypothetical protein